MNPTTPPARGWMRSYRPDELFDERGALVSELAELPPRATADERQSARERGLLLRDLQLPDFRDYAVGRWRSREATSEATRVLGASSAT